MVQTFYEPLSYLDSSFLALETRTTHMHVASVVIFESGPLTNDDGGIDIDRVRDHIESKLQYIPRYRQRLAYVPYNRAPVWVDDESFNFDYHVRHTSLPRPGSDAQLKKLAKQSIQSKRQPLKTPLRYDGEQLNLILEAIADEYKIPIVFDKAALDEVAKF